MDRQQQILARYRALDQQLRNRTIARLHYLAGLPAGERAFRLADHHDEQVRDILTRYYVTGFRLAWRREREYQRAS